MTLFSAEFFGSALIVLLGNGVVANVVLKQTKGHAAGWLAINAGWALAVTLALYAFGAASSGHFNPAVSMAMWLLGKISAAQLPAYLGGQLLGSMVGATLVWLAYLPHWKATADPQEKLACFATGPAISAFWPNLISEAIATAVLVFSALSIGKHFENDQGWAHGFAPILVGLTVGAIGLSLGGPTGYAINPARDLGPRLVHALLPIAGKGDSQWHYALVPILGPIAGGLIAALIFRSL